MFLRRAQPTADATTYREQLVYAAERLTYRDPRSRWTCGHKVSKQLRLLRSTEAATRCAHCAVDRSGQPPDAYAPAALLPAAAPKREVLRWRARTSLRDTRWQRLLMISPQWHPRNAKTEEWHYWRAVALQRRASAADAQLAFESLRAGAQLLRFPCGGRTGQGLCAGRSQLAADEADTAASRGRARNRPGARVVFRRPGQPRAL